MISRIFADRRRVAILRRVDRPSAILLAIAQAVVATAVVRGAGWLAVAIAGKPSWAASSRPVLGRCDRTSAGALRRARRGRHRGNPSGGDSRRLSLPLVPILAVLLWTVTYLELRIERGTGGQTIGRLLLTAILFGGATGILFLFGPLTWPTPIVLVVGLALPLALRSSEARGTMGVEGFGQALLHVLVVAQIGAALSCSTPAGGLPAHGDRLYTGARDGDDAGDGLRTQCDRVGALLCSARPGRLLLALTQPRGGRVDTRCPLLQEVAFGATGP